MYEIVSAGRSARGLMVAVLAAAALLIALPGAAAAAELHVVGKVELSPVVVGEPDVAVDDVPATLLDGDLDFSHAGALS